jgi:ribosomal protein L22
LGTTLPRRHFSQQNRAHEDPKPVHNPVLDATRNKLSKTGFTQAEEQQFTKQALAPPESGNIGKGSIFEDDRRIQQQINEEKQKEEKQDSDLKIIDPEVLAPVLNAVPKQRRAFLTKKIIQTVKDRGRVSKELMLKRTEREHLVRSHNMKTSVKKLGMIARQIAGKKIDDAIVQMRFSKKGVAREVLRQLEFARDEAVVMRGMGLGLDASNEAVHQDVNASEAPKPVIEPVDIQLKSGSRHTVSNPSDIYIDQAWVGRGPYGKLPDYRARGRMFIMRTPFTILSVVLKEEKTRIREWNEREEKRKKARTGTRVWQHLPDRPITNHRAWYNW